MFPMVCHSTTPETFYSPSPFMCLRFCPQNSQIHLTVFPCPGKDPPDRGNTDCPYTASHHNRWNACLTPTKWSCCWSDHSLPADCLSGLVLPCCRCYIDPHRSCYLSFHVSSFLNCQKPPQIAPKSSRLFFYILGKPQGRKHELSIHCDSHNRKTFSGLTSKRSGCWSHHRLPAKLL